MASLPSGLADLGVAPRLRSAGPATPGMALGRADRLDDLLRAGSEMIDQLLHSRRTPQPHRELIGVRETRTANSFRAGDLLQVLQRHSLTVDVAVGDPVGHPQIGRDDALPKPSVTALRVA